MDQTNKELWDEVLRTAELLRNQEPSLMRATAEATRQAAAGDRPLAEADFPVDYVADAQILTHLLLELRARGAKVT